MTAEFVKRSGLLVLSLSIVATWFGSAQATTFVDVSNPQNVLPGSTVVASDGGLSPFNSVAAVVDNKAAENDGDASFIFANAPGATPNSLAFDQFTAPAGLVDIRIYVANEPQRLPTTISAFSDTTDKSGSLVPGDYATSLGSFSFASLVHHPYSPDDLTGAARFYVDLPVHAPAGTQSLLVQFAGATAQTRVYEVQALVPEPSTFILGGLGLVGLLVAVRRRQIA